MPKNKQPDENEPGTLIHDFRRNCPITGIALREDLTRGQLTKLYRKALAKRGGDMLWAVTFEKKKLSADDIQWLTDAFYWLRDNPTGYGFFQLGDLMELVESWPGDE